MAKKTVGTLVNINNLTMWSRNESEETATYGEAVSFQKKIYDSIGYTNNSKRPAFR